MNVCWWLAWSLMIGMVKTFCPTGCSCDDIGPRARCVGAGVSIVPILFNPKLRFLNLAHNSIKSVSETLVFFDQLEELNLSHNQVSSLGIGNFDVQARLRELRLGYNNLTSLSPGSLRGLSSLTLLDLSHNILTDLPSSVLTDVPRITALLLAHNKLHTLSHHTFRGCMDLHVLDLCDNYFREVPTIALGELRSLRALHFCRNRLTSLQSNAFQTDTLSTLSLETNNINFISDKAFHRLQELLKLNLNDNMLNEVPTGALASLLKLESLHLSQNKFKSLDEGAFRSLGQLTMLEVSRCPFLEKIHSASIIQCVNLQYLTLSNNALLSHLPNGVFTFLPRLKSLDLSSNALRSLSASEVPWGSLTTLDLRGNPIVCNCSLQWLATLLSSSNSTVTTQDLKCTAPDKLNGVYISRLSKGELECVDQVQVVVGIVVISISSVLLIILSIIIWRYRQRRQKDKLGKDWPSESLAPWTPDEHTGAMKHIMADDYVYNYYTTPRHVPVAKV